MPCHYKSVKSFKWSIPNSDVKIDYHKKFSFQSFDFCVNSFVKGSLASDRAVSKSELARIPLTNGFTQKSKLWNENLSRVIRSSTHKVFLKIFYGKSLPWNFFTTYFFWPGVRGRRKWSFCVGCTFEMLIEGGWLR